jgi:hypothetical protein
MLSVTRDTFRRVRQTKTVPDVVDHGEDAEASATEPIRV